MTKLVHKLKDQKINDIRTIAADKIASIAPVWKQVNLTREGGPKANSIFSRIDAIRTYSDSLEAEVLEGSSVDITTGWPE